MTGAAEEVGKATGSIIDALKREPLSLALVIMNLALLGFFWIILLKVAEQREREINLIYADKRHIEELLSKCYTPTIERRTEQFGPFLPTGQQDEHIDIVQPPSAVPDRH